MTRSMNVPTLPPFDHQPAAYIGPSVAEVLKTRREFLNPGIFLYYKKPLMLVKGKSSMSGTRTGGVTLTRSDQSDGVA